MRTAAPFEVRLDIALLPARPTVRLLKSSERSQQLLSLLKVVALAAGGRQFDDALATELARLAMDELPYVTLGQWYGKTAYRKSITGVMQGLAPYPWNVKPA